MVSFRRCCILGRFGIQAKRLCLQAQRLGIRVGIDTDIAVLGLRVQQVRLCEHVLKKKKAILVQLVQNESTLFILP